MKRIFTLFLFFSITITLFSQWPKNRDFSFPATITAEENPPTLTITWPPNEKVKEVQIFRRTSQDSDWTTIKVLDSNTYEYVDTDVVPGQAYEYFLLGINQMWVKDNSGQEGTLTFGSMNYFYSGVHVSSNPGYGSLLLLVDETIAEPLKPEIDRLINDLITEGWGVIRHDVPRAESFDGDAVKDVKAIITQEYFDKIDDLSTVFILGRVPVPYSGLWSNPPDGHNANAGGHHGAWPSDMYYGNFSDFFWFDNGNMSNDQRKRNENLNGDGKFDPTALSSGHEVSLQVGRVDLYDMPEFHQPEWEEPEIELLKRYLDKNHAYRTGEMPYIERGLVDDNFQTRSNFTETFASCGYRNFSTFFGPDAVDEVDWFTTLETENYQWAYGTGGGSFTSAGGVGNTGNFASQPVNAVFTMLFGSYFGDWDVRNNFLRAPLCSEPTALTCGWAARPSWFLHHMAMGMPIGYSVRLSQNNNNAYYTNLYAQGQSWATAHFSQRGTHTGLMGDPTLRMHMNEVSPPLSLTASQTQDKFTVQLEWEPPIIEKVFQYDILRSESPEGPFYKVNDEPIDGLSYIDDFAGEGTYYYMVRSLEIVANNSGSFFNHSRGVIAEAVLTDVEEVGREDNISIAPNPANVYANINISQGIPADLEVQIFTHDGRLIRSLGREDVSAGSYTMTWNLRDESGNTIPAGVYIANIRLGTRSYTRPVVISR